MANVAVIERVLADFVSRAHPHAPSLPVWWVSDAEEGYRRTWASGDCAVERAARFGYKRWFGPAVPLDEVVLRRAWGESCLRYYGGPQPFEQSRAWLVSSILQLAAAHGAGLWAFWIASTEIVAVSHPVIRVEGGRLHCATGPAAWWPGGAAYYFWRGVPVPEGWIIRRDELSPETALTWPNVEQRRVAAEIIGWARVIERLPHRVVDAHANAMVGTLLEVDLPGQPRVRFLKVLCGTGRTFVLCVPRGCRTAVEAQAAMWPGLTQEEVLATLLKGRRA